MLNNGIDVQIGYVETHGRAGTEEQLAGLPIIPRRKIYYKGKELEEMDLDAILLLHPELVVVDELAHTNVEGSRHENDGRMSWNCLKQASMLSLQSTFSI